MRIILFIIQKEFIQVLRNKMMIPIIFLLPVVQLVILVHAATFEMKHIDVCIADQDLSSTSRRLAGKFEGSRFFAIKSNVLFFNRAQEKLKNGTAELIIHIPSGFEKKLQKKISAKDNKGDIQFIVNAINGRAAGLINAYAQNVLIDFNKEIITDWFKIQSKQLKNINIEYSYWYNPELDYKKNMLPGILVILTTVVGMFLTAINLVREKEMGTAEQINVTPIKKYQFIMGKLIPFLIIAYIELSIGLFLGVIFFNLPVIGSLLTLYSFAFVYLLVSLGLGLFISTITESQQQVMFMSFFFIIVFIMMSGLFTPVESMPEWAQQVNYINPFAYFIKVIRMVLLKGSGFSDIIKEFACLSVYAVIILSLAVWRYRKVA